MQGQNIALVGIPAQLLHSSVQGKVLFFQEVDDSRLCVFSFERGKVFLRFLWLVEQCHRAMLVQCADIVPLKSVVEIIEDLGCATILSLDFGEHKPSLLIGKEGDAVEPCAALEVLRVQCKVGNAQVVQSFVEWVLVDVIDNITRLCVVHPA